MNKLETSIIGTLIMPLTTIVSCANGNTNINVITSTYYNVYDNLISLGIIPNYSQIANKDNNWKVFKYIEKYTDLSKTKFTQISTAVTQPNLNLLAKLNTDTLVLNEWDRVNEEKYLERNIAAKNIAYTSMGDSEAGRDKKYFKKWGLEFKHGFANWSNALKMLAVDLDKRYQQLNLKFSNYLNIANEIEKQNEERIKFIKGQISIKSEFKDSIGNMKSIGIVSGLSGSAGIALPPEEENRISKIFSPFIYPQLYSPDFGLGFEFVDLSNQSEATTYKEPSATIKSIDMGKFKEIYKNKFDYLLFMKSPYQNYDDANKIASQLKYLLRDSSNNRNIQVIEYVDWYPTTWGAIGNYHLLSNIINVLNKFEPNTKIEDINNSYSWPFKKEELIVSPLKLPNII